LQQKLDTYVYLYIYIYYLENNLFIQDEYEEKE